MLIWYVLLNARHVVDLLKNKVYMHNNNIIVFKSMYLQLTPLNIDTICHEGKSKTVSIVNPCFGITLIF